MHYYFRVLKKYAVFSGRAQRSEYWYFFLFSFIISFVLMIAESFARIEYGAMNLGLLSLLYFLAVFVPNVAVSVRRMHDTGKSGWMILVGLIPFIGFIWLLILLVRDSQPGDNKYGPNPKGPPAPPELVSYLEQIKNEGVTVDSVIPQLLASGWTNEQIAAARQEVPSSVIPSEDASFQSENQTKTPEGIKNTNTLAYSFIFITILVFIGSIGGAYVFLHKDNPEISSYRTDSPSVPTLKDSPETSSDSSDSPALSVTAVTNKNDIFCFISNEKTLNTDPRPTLHGVRFEITCAHQTMIISGYNKESSDVRLVDQNGDLIKAGEKWAEEYRKINRGSFFATTALINDIDFKVDGRVLKIEAHSNAIPYKKTATLEGTLAVIVETEQVAIVDTTVGAIRNHEKIHLPEVNVVPIVSNRISFGSSGRTFNLFGGAIYEGLIDPPSGVEEGTSFGQKGITISEEIANDTPLQIEVKISEEVLVPLNITVKY